MNKHTRPYQRILISLCAGLFMFIALLLTLPAQATPSSHPAIQPTPTPTPITTHPANQSHPRVAGDVIVWRTFENGTWQEVRGYDTAAQREFVIITSTNVFTDWVLKLDVSERFVVFRDERPVTPDGDPDDQPGLYAYDLEEDTDGDGTPNYLDDDRPYPDPALFPITTADPETGAGVFRRAPAIDDVEGCIVVWQDYRDGFWAIYGLDLCLDSDEDGTPDVREPDFDPTWSGYRISCCADNWNRAQQAPAISYPIVVYEDMDWRDGVVQISGYDLSVDSDGDGIPNWRDDRPWPWYEDPARIHFAVGTNPAISWPIVTWIDWHKPADIDLYGYDLTVDSDGDGVPNYRDPDRPCDDPAIFPVTTTPGDQYAPAISYPLAVWADVREGGLDLWGYDFSVDSDGDGVPNYRDPDRPQEDPAEFLINRSPTSQWEPDISGRLVVWRDDPSGNDDIFAAIIPDFGERTPSRFVGDPRYRYQGVCGARPNDNAGQALVVADFNGDGLDDLIVGAPGADGPTDVLTDTGKVYVLLGRSDFSQAVHDLLSDADLIIQGVDAYDSAGQALAAGDVNGDGRADLIIGAPSADPEWYRSGMAYVVYGRELTATRPITLELGTQADVTIYGPPGAGIWAWAGTSVAVGDINDDTYDDIIVGAPGVDLTDWNDGEVLVFLGGPNLPARLDSDTDPAVRILGPEAEAELGTSVATADINGDGLDDVLVGALYVDGPTGGRYDAGAAYVVLGSAAITNASPTVVSLPDQAALVVHGAADGDVAESAVGGGDADGDGYDDLIVGALGVDGPTGVLTDTGAVYVVPGRALVSPVEVDLANESVLTVHGPQEWAQLGAAAFARDFDRDGRDDLLLGAPGAGDAYLILMAQRAMTGTIDLATGADLIVHNPSLNSMAGQAVGGGDLDGDGRDEILVGTPGGSGPYLTRHGAGQVDIIAGPEVTAGWLALIYLNGDNNLYTDTVKAFNYLEVAACRTPSTAIRTLWDESGNGDTWLYRVRCDEVKESEPGNKYQEGVDKWRLDGEAERDMGDPYTLRRFIEWGRKVRPTAPALLSIVGHGNGWSPQLYPPQPTHEPPVGISWDETNGGTYLATRDIGEALRDAGGSLDVLYFDACQMALLENAYEVRDSVHYLVASQATAWGGFHYETHLDELRAETPPRELALDIVDSYSASVSDYPFTISALDLAALDPVTFALNGLADALRGAVPDHRDTIYDVYLASQKFDADVDYTIAITEAQVDLKDFTTRLAAEADLPDGLREAADTLAEAIGPVGDPLVIAERHQSGHPWVRLDQFWNLCCVRGLSIYLPLGRDEWLRDFYTCNQLSLACDTRWDEFVQAWYSFQPAPQMPDAPPDLEHLPGPLYVPDDDVYGLPYELWTWPPTVHANQPFTVGLTVHRLGGKLTGGDVEVEFRAGDAGLGSATAPPLWPDGSVTGVITAPALTSQPVTLSAAIDPGTRITDTLSANNAVTRTLTFLPIAEDTLPPPSVVLTTEQHIVTTPEVTLHLKAEDEPGGSGLCWVYLQEYVMVAGSWMLAQTSGWQPFATSLSWQLAPCGGAHYLHAWVADIVGNISPEPGGILINYLPASDRVGQGQARVYRLPLVVGQTLSATLTPIQPGDADLYLWDLYSSLVSSSTAAGPDQLSHTADKESQFQLEVCGDTDADFALQVVVDGTAGARLSVAATNKSVPQEPMVDPISRPPDRIALPAVPVRRLYLPIVLRN
jgi:hypothetical protein